MKQLDSRDRHVLAGEYVLGTLAGRARERFARLMQQDYRFAQAAAQWELRLGALAAGVEPVSPPPWVWQRIEQRLGFSSGAEHRPVASWQLFTWRALAGVSTVAVAALAFVLVTQEPVVREVPVEVPVPQPVPVDRMAAVLTGEEARSAWMVSAPVDGARLTVRTLNPKPLPPGKAYELWLLPVGQNPISLGLVPTEGEKSIEPPPELRALIRPGMALAVSLEPAGGSPTGLPTGPVLYQGKSQVL